MEPLTFFDSINVTLTFKKKKIINKFLDKKQQRTDINIAPRELDDSMGDCRIARAWTKDETRTAIVHWNVHHVHKEQNNWLTSLASRHYIGARNNKQIEILSESKKKKHFDFSNKKKKKKGQTSFGGAEQQQQTAGGSPWSFFLTLPYFALSFLVLSCFTHTHTHTADEREEEKKKGE